MGLFDILKNKKASGARETAVPTEVQSEIDEALHFCIHSGFFSQNEIFEQAQQTFEDVCTDSGVAPPSESYIKQTIERIANANPVATDKNNYVRLRSVFDALNRERIIEIQYAGYTLDDGFV